MNREEIAARFRVLAEEIAEKEFSGLSEESTIVELGVDSLGLLELMGSMEREFGVRIPAERIAHVRTVGQVIDLLTQSSSENGEIDKKRVAA